MITQAKNKDVEEPEKFPLTTTLEPTADWIHSSNVGTIECKSL